MTDVPVKPISEIEEKSEVSVNDKILILDSVSEEARLASKSELKWDKGDQGNPWTPWAAATVTVGTTTTGAAGTSASVTNSGTSSAAILNFTIPKGDKWDTGAAWKDWKDGADGKDGTDGEDWNGIASITSSKSWKITTVTITETNGDSESFTVSDWADGQWSGDVIWPNSSTDWHLAVFDGVTGKLIKDWGSVPTSFSPSSAGTQWQVLTKWASGYDWATVSGWDVQVSTDTGNLLSTGVKLWLGDKADFDDLLSLDSNTIYAPITWIVQPRTPWVNTVLYMPLEWNTTDMSLNPKTITNDWNAWYSTISSGLQVLNLTWSQYLSTSLDIWTTFTVNFYLYLSWTTIQMIWSYGPDSNLWLFHSGWDLVTWSWNNIAIPSFNLNSWHLITIVNSWSERKTYMDWTLKSTFNISITYTSWKIFYIGSNNTSFKTTWMYSKFILENKARTAQEISDYYNATKATYGIS